MSVIHPIPKSAHFMDLTGQRYGRLVVVSYAGRRPNKTRGKMTMWNCRCDCGNVTTTAANRLRSGTTRSCGCLAIEFSIKAGRRRRDVMVVNLADQRFGRLIATERQRAKNGRLWWRCQCDCGGSILTSSFSLLSGKTKSCGCARLEAVTDHGHTANNSPTRLLFATWGSMIARCNSIKHKSYSRYGGRGITVCQRWLESFQNFLDDMGLKPTPEHSIDRKKNDKGYWCGKCEECIRLGRPANCRWATKQEQAENRRKIASLSAFTDAELLAEVRRRGLSLQGVSMSENHELK